MSQERPDGANVPLFQGERVAIVAARWNGEIIDRLIEGCQRRLVELLVEDQDLFRVPGSFELPTAAKWAAQTGRYAAVVCLGCVVRGETPHFDLVAGEAARGINEASLSSGVACLFGVLAVNTREQAVARVGVGREMAEAAAEMAALRRSVDALVNPRELRRAISDLEGDLADRLRAEDAERRRPPSGPPVPMDLEE